jgi:hypothetical protein
MSLLLSDPQRGRFVRENAVGESEHPEQRQRRAEVSERSQVKLLCWMFFVDTKTEYSQALKAGIRADKFSNVACELVIVCIVIPGLIILRCGC